MTYQDDPLHISCRTLRLIRAALLAGSASAMAAAVYNLWAWIDWHQVVQLMGSK